MIIFSYFCKMGIVICFNVYPECHSIVFINSFRIHTFQTLPHDLETMIINTAEQLTKFYFTALNNIETLIGNEYLLVINGKHMKM